MEVAQLPDLPQGHGLWRVNDRAFVVHHLVTPDEAALFDTNQRMAQNPRQFRGFPTEILREPEGRWRWRAYLGRAFGEPVVLCQPALRRGGVSGVSS